METVRILIVRHGESEWNRQHRWQGWEDIALTATGEAQARARGTDLLAGGPRFAAIYTSDLERAARTADLIAQTLDRPPAIRDVGLRERFGGEWQGSTSAEIDARWPGQRAAWRRGELAAPPGGEIDSTVLERVHAALERIAAARPGGPVLVVTHHGVLRLLSTRAGVAVTELIPNLGGRWFDWRAGNLTAHAAIAPVAATPPDATE
jgi:bisphosphoglycerate-dependent phosphoglycerate mutase family 1